ncbi:alpha/beta fold hydrolase [Paracoccus sp. PS-1]|uniref:alpha/beta hydrolase n=1 Tax=unclassified Paracoccus (in: a-proteobacteria) TaxID=2688777 RepID=UPI00048ED2E0|nr:MULTISPECIES: alpha/beta fold hydrolase [unclassified Paracoccus (in: a-proteobacteria)]MDQ7261155.1 alpha/beta fold hydrolase [Paracoccus sp. PS1]
MLRELKSERKGPQKPDSVVVFLHGYGADGADLLGLADPLAPHLPGTAFYSPDAPEPCLNNPMGYQWFPIPWMDGSSEEQARSSAEQSFKDINAFLDKVLADEGLTPDRLALVGFSQGTMMALAVAPQRDAEIAGVVGFSGRLLDTENLDKARVRPPILLVHGDQDPTVPFESMGIAGEALQKAGFTVYGHVMKNTGHGISPDGLSVALAFLKERFAAKP